VTARTSITLQFQRPEHRAEFDRLRRELKAALREVGLEEGADRLFELGATLDNGVARLKRELLGSTLCWNDDSRRVAAWIHQQHSKLTGMAARVVEAMRATKPESALLTRTIACTLYHWGEAIKWASEREPLDYAPLHDMLKFSMAGGRYREAFSWVADGRGRTVTLEALYLRALLLDRFASGNLTRQQVEILDAWLWEWTSVLKTVADYPGGAVLRVDLDENAGLREGRGEGGGLSLYLPLAPLEAQRRLLIKELHHGRIFPAVGCTAEFRIEEHVVVLDHLARAFRPHEDSHHERATRRHEAPARVEMWVGLPEILARGAGVQVGTDTGRWRALMLADPAVLAGVADAGNPGRGNADVSRRCLWLVDTSEGGCGFEAQEVDAAGIEVGDIVGWRRATHGPMILGRVARRRASAIAGQVFLGVQLLTERGLAFTLSRIDGTDRAGAETFLFVPGDDASGCGDAFLLPEATFQLRHSYRARIDDESYTLRFNRVRASGRGWILAGFEIVPAEAAEKLDPKNEELTFKLELDDPWSNEVSRRLQP